MTFGEAIDVPVIELYAVSEDSYEEYQDYIDWAISKSRFDFWLKRLRQER